MMRKSCFVIFFMCLSLVFVGAASAQMYMGAKLMYVMTSESDWSIAGFDSGEVEYDGGFGFGVAIGSTMDQVRLEGELEYRAADVDEQGIDGDLTTWSLMANGYYDLEMGSALKPYIGAGVGFATHKIDATIEGIGSGDESDTVFAYQVSLGAAWAVSNTMDLDCGYRYFATSDPDFDGLEAEYASHNISVGVRFKF